MTRFFRNAVLGMAMCALAVFGQGLFVEGTQVQAAPRLMEDGNLFDAEYYAAQYPDVAEALGTTEEALYFHYLTFGITEGRRGFSEDVNLLAGQNLSAYTEDQLVQLIVLSNVTPGMNEVEIATVLNDYLVNNMEYDYSYSHHSTYDALAYGTGVCQGYANAYQRLMNAAGIQTDYVRGYGYSRGSWGRHGWNRSLIGGQYYYTDVTWNDTSRGNRYLLLSQEEMNRDHQEVCLNPARIM